MGIQERRATKEIGVLLGLRDPFRAQDSLLDLLWEPMVSYRLSAPLVCPVLQERQAIQVLQDPWVLLEILGLQEKGVNAALTERMENKERKALRVRQEMPGNRDLMVKLDTREKKVIEEIQDYLVFQERREQRDQRALLGPRE